MRYFSTQRPLTPGAFPKPSDNRVIAVENFDTYDGRLIPQKFPQYVKTYDGYIGVLIGLEYGEFPIYRFPGGERVADQYEIETGSNARSDLE